MLFLKKKKKKTKKKKTGYDTKKTKIMTRIQLLTKDFTSYKVWYKSVRK